MWSTGRPTHRSNRDSSAGLFPTYAPKPSGSARACDVTHTDRDAARIAPRRNIESAIISIVLLRWTTRLPDRSTDWVRKVFSGSRNARERTAYLNYGLSFPQCGISECRWL